MAMTNEELEAGLLQARTAIINLRQDYNSLLEKHDILRQQFDSWIAILKKVRDTQVDFVMWDQIELAGVSNFLVYAPAPGAREETFGDYIYRRRRRVSGFVSITPDGN